jgi:hypothetical protein
MNYSKRYVMREAKGGGVYRFYIWDIQKRCMKKGNLEKETAIELEHKLNDRKFIVQKGH